MKAELLKGLTEEQIAKVKACKTTEEILAVAKEESIELTDDQLEAVSGGCDGTTTKLRKGKDLCPNCHSSNINEHWIAGRHSYYCNMCGKEFDAPYKR